MARPVLEAMDMDTLTKGRYVQLLARGYSPKEVFKALLCPLAHFGSTRKTGKSWKKTRAERYI
ncbi:hypothetical protein [Enterococcus faecium]|uniref:hypothetical protein n=1 Tax=Enterococcus faecium TaxID=1352 RepID=UPI00111F698A|nr:hypothetical protein [Enterococcus faecium]MBD9782053.1 hypothetical protein [Enterococcus faecium]QDB91603.1 hypothetical protein FHK65_13510 [Enterococcus faecium]